MSYERIEKYNYPKWLVWVCWDIVIMAEGKTWWIIFECEKTWLGVLCFADEVGKIIRMRCLSLWDDWVCVNWNWPKDDLWNRVCNIITQIKK